MSIDLSSLSSTGSGVYSPADKSHGSSWFEALAEAWSQTLDRQASRIETLSARVSGGDDKPGTVTELAAAAQVLNAQATAAHTSISSAGEGVTKAAQK
jgi:hypothetical protein